MNVWLQLFVLFSQINNVKYYASVKEYGNICNKIQIHGLFEVFPELEATWPKWMRTNGKRMRCKTDEDCEFPQACCHHPILPGDHYCCSGNYKKRALKPAYARQNAH